MKATREQVLAMAREACPFTTEVWHEDEWHFTAADLEAFAHKLQQFERDQLRAQGVTAWMFKGAILRDAEYHPGAFAGTNAKPLYTIPETLE
jgi:hypothetical protein